jgi:hypothetical protein
MTITKQQLIDKYNEVYAADNGVNKTFVELTKDEKVEALLQFVTAISGGSGGDASATNQTAVQANPGSDATKAVAVQGVTGGKSIPVTGTFFQNIQPVSMTAAPAGLAYESSTTITITRAATTTYTASAPNFDVYGSLFQLQNIGEAGKGIFLSYFEISLDLSAVPQGMTSFAVHLYPTAPTTIADNSIWTIGSDPVLDPVGFNVSMSLAKGGGKVVGVATNINQLFILTSSSLWGYLVTNGAIVPTANSETGTIRARSFAP